MIAKKLLDPILDDDNLTRGLGDAEARMLVEWLVEKSDRFPAAGEETLRRNVGRLCRRARAVSRFVFLWCHRFDHGAACQLAATERFAWPLPSCDVDPCDLLAEILAWEESTQFSS